MPSGHWLWLHALLLQLLSASCDRVTSRGGGAGSQGSQGSNADDAAQALSFDAFIQRHRRTYRPGSAEYEQRRALFEGRAKEAAHHNSQLGRLWTYDAENSFADRTPKELAALRGWRGPLLRPPAASFLEKGLRRSRAARHGQRQRCALPAAQSWALLKATRTVRDQGACGSCSALATAATLEAHHEIHRGGARSFAPQELVSCATNPESCGGEGGCGGGFVELLMSYASRHGLHAEEEYPYTSGMASETGTCGPGTRETGFVETQPGVYSAPDQSPSRAFGMVGYERLPINRYEPLMRALVERGPVAVALAASGWHFYGGGVFDRCQRDPVIDHAVMLFGFGQDAETGTKFWHLHNSWGPEWGEEGQIRLLRREDEEAWCGSDAHPELGAACAKHRNGTRKSMPLEPVEVCGSCGILFNTVVPHFEGSTRAATRLAQLRAGCGAA